MFVGCARVSPPGQIDSPAHPLPASVPPTPLPVRDATPPSADPKIVELPGVTVNMTERYVELKGKVCLREGLLELVATVPAGKEHESIVSLQTRPSNIHAALLMLGLKPGEPGRWRYEGTKAVAIDPKGDRVRLTLRWERDGKWEEKPINEFILDREGKKHAPSDEFVFAGSRVVEPKGADGKVTGPPVYLADQTGDIVALVSFDDEVLAWPTAASDSNDELFWVADPATIPPLGTEIRLRVYPVAGGKPR